MVDAMTTNTCWHETLLVGKFPWNKHLMGDFPAKHLWFSRCPKKPWFCVGSTHFGDLIWEGLNILWRNGLTSMFSIVFAYYPDLVVKPRYPFFCCWVVSYPNRNWPKSSHVHLPYKVCQIWKWFLRWNLVLCYWNHRIPESPGLFQY